MRPREPKHNLHLDTLDHTILDSSYSFFEVQKSCSLMMKGSFRWGVQKRGVYERAI